MYERETYAQIGFKTGDSMRNFVLFEINMVQPRKNYMIFTQLQKVGLAKLHIFKRSMTVKELKLKVFTIVRWLLKIP